MPDVTVNITQRTSVTVNETPIASVTINPEVVNTAREVYRVEKFSRTAGTGYTTLTANQLAGTDPVTLGYVFRINSIQIFRNGILMEKTAEYTEATDRTGFTLVGTYDTTDKFEARYVKNN